MTFIHSTRIIALWAISFFAVAAPSLSAENTKTNWQSSIAAGLTLTRGNSETLLFTAHMKTRRTWPHDELSLGLDATYGDSDGEKTAESVHGFAQENHLFNERLYGGLKLDALHDDVADVDYRFTIAPLAGCYLVKTGHTTLSAEAGPAFIYEKQGEQRQGFVTLRVGEKFERKLSKTSRLWQSLEFLPQVDDFENHVILAELGLEAALTDTLSLRTFVQNSYDNEPAENRKKNDVKLVSALAYKF